MQPHTPPAQVRDGREVSETHRTVMADLELLVQIEDPDAAAHGLANLRAVLPGHFAHEEVPDGVFDWIVALAPYHRRAVQELVNDHHSLLAELEDLGPLHDASGDPIEEALDQARAFCAHMREHEARESELLEAIGA